MEKGVIIKVENLIHHYYTKHNEIHALQDVNMEIREGQFLSIVGPSGCGKTTLLSLISGLNKVQQGEVIRYCEEKDRKDFFGYMLQRDELFEWRSVRRNIMLPLEIRRKKTKENVAYAMELVEKYGLKDFLDKKPRELSGGMRQRVALIRTLVLRPRVLLLDEPFSALDFQTRLAVQQDVHNIIKAENITAVLVTHDIDEAVSMSDVVAIMSNRPATIREFAKTNHQANTSLLQRREKIKLGEWHARIFGRKEGDAQ